MRNKISLALFVIVTVIIFGYNPAYSQTPAWKSWRKSSAVIQPIIDNAVWENISKDKAYNNCITALHLQNFELEAQQTSKESGLIATHRVKFYPCPPNKSIGGEYYLNILVYETEGNKVSINIQIKDAKWYKIEPAWGFKESAMENSVNNKVSDDIEEFFTKLESMQGKAISKKEITLNWK